MKKFMYLIGFILTLIFTAGCCVFTAENVNRKIKYQHQKSLVSHLQNVTVALADKERENIVCTGVWINDHYFITARHCVENDDESVTLGTIRKFYNFDQFDEIHYNRRFYGLPENLETATVIAFSRYKDIALLYCLEDTNHEVANIYQGEIFDGLSPVHLMGHPGPTEYTYTKGFVSKTRVMGNFGLIQKTLQISALIYSGSSGGGAFTETGDLIGITLFSYVKVPGMFFFLHRDEIVYFLKQNTVTFYYGH